MVFAAFVFIEMKIATYPFAPGHMIFDRSLFACYLANFWGSGAYTAVLFFVPLFYQAVLGASATVSGAYLIPATIAVVTASVGGGWVIKKTGRYYWATVLSMGLSLLSIVPLVVSVWFKLAVGEIIGVAMCGFGVASTMTTTLVALIAHTAKEDMALAVASSYLFRSLGSSLGVSFSMAALQQVLRTQLSFRFPDGDEAKMIEEKVRESLDYIRHLSPGQADQVRMSYKMATFGAYVPTAVFLVAGFLATFWVREKALAK